MRRARFVINALALRPVYPRVSRRALRPRTNPKRRDTMERTLGKSADARPDVITFSLANPKEKVTKRKDWSASRDLNMRGPTPRRPLDAWEIAWDVSVRKADNLGVALRQQLTLARKGVSLFCRS